jgi:GST-like protein
VQRGRRVNKSWGPEEERLIERHSASDFAVPARTQRT